MEKLRTDLAKFEVLKPGLMAQGIYAQCFFVCAEAPSESLIETSRGQHVTVLSHEQLEQRFFDYHKYHFVRSSKRFGSAVDPYSGEKDERPYIRVHYEDVNRLRRYTISDLIRLVLNGKRIILLGNYGTGKSRCVQELFSEAASFAGKRHVYPLAIDLRENWGLRRSGEIVRRHFDDLGLSQHADAIVKVLETGAVCLLMDGFDEIVSQVWSDDAIHLEAIRKESLSGVRDLISRVRGGVLITGREHYFNSEQEMVECLGFHPDYTISCAEEFSEDEMAEYLAGKTPGLAIPKWLPRRPLISQLLARLEAEALTELLKEPGGETKFWYSLLDAICIREAQIHPSLSPDTIRGVLLEIAHASREKPQNFGPITLSAMNEAFERVVGRPPRDEASAMLQSLPMLGRVEAETSDRQFLDSYILDGLRATSLIETIGGGHGHGLVHETWINPLGDFGRSLLAENAAIPGVASGYLRVIRESATSANKILAGDLLSALLTTDVGQMDFRGLKLSDSHLGS